MVTMEANGNVVDVTASGTLTSEDYDRLVPELERLTAEYGPLRIYIELRDFSGWTPPALWKDIRFDARHQHDMERIAVVGEKRLEDWGTKLSKPFLEADMRFFPREEAEEARRWVTAG